MADENTNVTQQQDTQQAQDALGKRVGGFKTGLTKTLSGLAIVAATATVVMGAIGLIKGRTVLEGKWNPLGTLASDLIENERVATAAATGAGLAVGVIGKAGWDSASSASRTRKYIDTLNAVNSQDQGQGRG